VVACRAAPGSARPDVSPTGFLITGDYGPPSSRAREALDSRDVSPFPTQLTGAAGEYLVAAELSRRGWAASITPKGVQRSDVLAQHAETQRVVAIQVKTARSGGSFRLNEKLETPTSADNEWVVFVALHEGEADPPEYYVVPRNLVSALIYVRHRSWLATPGRNGRPHKDTPVRNITAGQIGAYRNAWHLLDGSSHDVPYDRLPDWFDPGVAQFGLPPEHPGVVRPDPGDVPRRERRG
jgi:hypothetical protein